LKFPSFCSAKLNGIYNVLPFLLYEHLVMLLMGFDTYETFRVLSL